MAAAATGSAWNVAIALLDEMPTIELRLGIPNLSQANSLFGQIWYSYWMILIHWYMCEYTTVVSETDQAQLSEFQMFMVN